MNLLVSALVGIGVGSLIAVPTWWVAERLQRRYGRWKLREYVVHSGIDPVLDNTSIGDLSGLYLTRRGAAAMARRLNRRDTGPSALGTTYEVRAVRRDHVDELHNEVIVERAGEISARLEDWTN